MIQNRPPPVNPEGVFDLNIILNFGKQWPEMKDFAYETRDQLFQLIYNVEFLGALVLGFIVGVLLTVVVFKAMDRRRIAVIAALLLATVGGFAQSPEPQVDLTTLKYVDKNFGSKIDGAGMCVFNSFRASLVSQYRDDFDDYARWLAANFPGGGYPQRVTEYTKAYTRAKGIEGFDAEYVQIVGEETIHEIRDALENGRSVAVTDSGDVSFYGRPVPHMTNIVYLDDRTAGIVDNNRPDRVEWITKDAFFKRHRQFDAGWCIIYLGKPQLQRPVNVPPPEPPDREPYRRASWLDCPDGNCFRLASLNDSQTTNQGGEWKDQGNGLWYYYRNGVRVGEYHEKDKRYYTYRSDGSGRSWLEPTERPDGVKSSESKDIPTGVYYGGFPKLLPGQTLYGYGSTPIADAANQRLYQDRTKRDKKRARVVVNGDSALEQRIRDMLSRLKSDAYVYGREALDVIQALRYGKGVTVTTGITSKGVQFDVGYFNSDPDEASLRKALTKADPDYKPGGGITSETVDGVLVAMAIILAGLVAAFFYLSQSQPQGAKRDN